MMCRKILLLLLVSYSINIYSFTAPWYFGVHRIASSLSDSRATDNFSTPFRPPNNCHKYERSPSASYSQGDGHNSHGVYYHGEYSYSVQRLTKDRPHESRVVGGFSHRVANQFKDCHEDYYDDFDNFDDRYDDPRMHEIPLMNNESPNNDIRPQLDSNKLTTNDVFQKEYKYINNPNPYKRPFKRAIDRHSTGKTYMSDLEARLELMESQLNAYYNGY